MEGAVFEVPQFIQSVHVSSKQFGFYLTIHLSSYT